MPDLLKVTEISDELPKEDEIQDDVQDESSPEETETEKTKPGVAIARLREAGSH